MLLVLLCTACASAPPRLAQRDVVHLATAAARREHVDMRALLPPTADCHPEDRTWFVHWTERPEHGMVHIGGDYMDHS